jgi:predicted transposase YdaD
VLSGLIHDPAELERSFRNLVMTLEDSATYQMIMHPGEKQGEARGLAVGEARGETRGLQSVLLRYGSRHYGPVTESVQKSLLAINDHERLLRLTDRSADLG